MLHADRSYDWIGNTRHSIRRQNNASRNCDRLHAVLVHLLLQAIMGRNNLDLDVRDFLHERPLTSRWHVFSDAERRTSKSTSTPKKCQLTSYSVSSTSSFRPSTRTVD